MFNRAEFRKELEEKSNELCEEPISQPEAVVAMFKGYDAKVEKLGKVGDTHFRLVQSELTGGMAVVVADFEGSEPVTEEIEVNGEIKVRKARTDDGRTMNRTSWSLVGRKRFSDADEARSWAREYIQAWKAVLHEREVGEGEVNFSQEPVGGADI